MARGNPCGFELLRDGTSGSEVHLIGRLSTKRRMRKVPVVLVDIECKQVPDGGGRVMGVQVQPLVIDHSVNLSTTSASPGSERATRDNQGSTRNAVVEETPDIIHGLDTGYTIASGDAFNTHYMWKDRGNWDDASDRVGLTLFTTSDNTLTGLRKDLVTNFSGTVATMNTDNVYELVLNNAFYTAQSADVGKNLFLELDGWDGNGFADGEARVDDFVLSVGAADGGSFRGGCRAESRIARR